MTTLPLVGLPADTYEDHGFLFHSLGDKYVRALADVSQVLPLMIPSLMDENNIHALLDHFDGVLMTGAVSNVHPPHYGEPPSADHEPYDHNRDGTTLKLIRAFGRRYDDNRRVIASGERSKTVQDLFAQGSATGNQQGAFGGSDVGCQGE